MDEEIKKLLEQNLAYSQEIYAMTKKIKRHLTFQKIVSLIYLLLIVAPIIIGVIYLPPLLNQIYGQYKDVLGLPAGGSIQDLLKSGADNPLNSLLKSGAGGIDLNKIDLNNLPPQVKALLNK